MLGVSPENRPVEARTVVGVGSYPPGLPLLAWKALRFFFVAVTSHPRICVASVLLVVLAAGAGLLRLRFDNRPDAFIPPGHPALLSKEHIERAFGLEDPMLIGVVALDPAGNPLPDGIFQERPLRVIAELSQAVTEHLRAGYANPGSHPVYSLATEYDVELVGGLPEERRFLEPFPRTPEERRALKEAVFRLELYTGVIVSEDGSAGAIVIVPPEGAGQEVYRFVAGLVAARRAALETEGLRLALAGEAAVRAAMGDAVVHSALRLNPACVAVVIFFLFAAFRSLTGVLLPLAVVGSGAAVMLGTMGHAGVPIYIITNAILVTVMSLGVADAIHVLSEYCDQLREELPSRQELVVRANERLWIPVLYTSLTDMAGFASFFFTGIMPPLEWFGLFTAVGVGATLLASFTLLPAMLMGVDPEKARHRRLEAWALAGPIAGALGALCRSVLARPRLWLLGGAVVVLGALAGASRLRVRQSMVSAFDRASRIVEDDEILNRLFHGTYFLDVLLEAAEPGTFLEPRVLRKIEELEEYAAGLPRVGGSLSVAGFARKMNEILNDWDPRYRRLPEDRETVAEHFEELQASPSKYADLLHVVERRYQNANVRLRLSTGEYHEERDVVEALEAYLKEHFPPAGGIRATLSGRVNMDTHWVRLIVRGHIQSVVFTLVVIVVFLAALFRSLSRSLLCLFPVAVAVLATYAAMGAAGIALSIGTSMFASLAIGVGVNFPIHFLDRLRVGVEVEGLPLPAALERVFRLTGKALLFNALAVACGFLALLFSDLPLLRHFGLMIALGIASCCLATLTLLPAAVVVLERRRGTPPGSPP